MLFIEHLYIPGSNLGGQDIERDKAGKNLCLQKEQAL